LARFTAGINVQAVHAAAGAPVFQTQSIAHSASHGPIWARRDIGPAAAGGLESRELRYTPPAGAAAGAWAGHGAAVGGVALPAMKVSATGRIAIEDTPQQARVFFIDPTLVPGFNQQLKGEIEILLQPAVTIDLPNPFNTTLTQATIGVRGPQPATPKRTLKQLLRGQQPVTPPRPAPTAPAGTLIGDECNRLAGYAVGNSSVASMNPPAIPPNAGAAPGVNQVFAFKTSYDDSALITPFANLQGTHGGGGNPDQQIEQTITTVLNDLAALETQVAGGGGYGGHMPEALVMLPGWGTHYEAVIAVDGQDRLTVANYNRDREIGWEMRKLFRRIWSANAAFRSAFINLHRPKLTNPLAWGIFMEELMNPLRPELDSSLTGQERAAVQELRTFKNTKQNLAGGMYYFDMYGPNDTFLNRYTWAGRGSGGVVWVIN
jgi:hypothetical protein